MTTLGPGVDGAASELIEAASVLLLRDGPDGLETFTVLRHTRSAAFAGMLVFPGGQVDPQDATPEIQACCADLVPAEAERRLAPLRPAERAMAQHLAAVRELFEEAGVLLARRGAAWVDTSRRAEQVAQVRAALHDGRIDFLEACRRLDVVPAPGALAFFAHWIPPLGIPKRFDTRFFVVPVPPGQEASHDGRETSAGEWLAPAEALDRYRRRETQLAPPTFMLLAELAGFADVAQAMATAASRRVVTVVPRLFAHPGGGPAFLYPGDVAYEGGDPDRPGPRRRLVVRDGLFEQVVEG